MFNRYWRSYPWLIQFIQLIVLIMVMMSFFILGIVQFMLHMSGFSLADLGAISIHSSRALINMSLWAQFFSAIGIFLVPALLFAYFSHPNPRKYLGLKKPGKPIHWLLSILLILSAFPIFNAIAEAISHLDLGASAKLAQEQNDRIFEAYLNIQTPVQFLITFLVLAILPGLSEELFFRGIIMRFAAKKSPHIIFPMVLSSLIFAMMHTNIYGLASIFLAGMLLATIYYLTGSIWCGIVCHMIFNGTQVILSYIATQSAEVKNFITNESVPVGWVVGGAVVFAASFYALWKNRTPLPKDWAEDYTAEELIAEEE